MKQRNNYRDFNKGIRIFISSTFKDLVNERNYLMRRTFPKLREEALKYGISITELDLRWGITEDESKLGQVLQICLEEVDNAVPFFIGIIGKKYGWIPSIKDINQNALESYPQIKTYLKREISITEMEVRYGVISRQENMHAIFFVSKEEPDELDTKKCKKLLKLRKLIIENGKYPVYHYSTPEDISEKVEEYFIHLLKTSFPSTPKSPIEEEMNSQMLYAKSITENYVNNADHTKTMMHDWLQSGKNTVLILGESGIGKSTFIANWVLELQRHATYRDIIIPQFVGHGGNHCSGEYIKNIILQKISQYTDISIDSSSPQKGIDNQLSDIINKVSKNKRCIIIIDGINQIVEDEKSSFLQWIPKICSHNVKIVLSSIRNDYNTKKLISQGGEVIEIKSLTIDEKKDFITKYLSPSRKKLETKTYDMILCADIFKNSLALRMLLDSIVLFSDYESVKLDIREFVSCSSVSNFYQKVLSKFDEEFGHALSQNVFSYIYVSKGGLYESELIDLCNITPLLLTQMFRLMKRSLIEENGRIRFAHTLLEDAVVNHYLKQDSVLINNYKKKLILYFEPKDCLRTRNELPFLYSELSMKDSLYDFLMKPSIAEYYLEYNIAAFAFFWRRLQNNDSSYKITDYLTQKDTTSDNFLSLLGHFCIDVMRDNNSAQFIFQHKPEQSEKRNEEWGDLTESIFKGIEGLEVVNMPDWLRYTSSFCNLGDVKYHEGAYTEALTWYHKAIGSGIDEKLFFDYETLMDYCMPHKFWNDDNREYCRAAYAFHKLGSTYDELGCVEIACLMYQRAYEYLSGTDDDTDLMSQIFQDWAVSMANKDPHESINLLKRSINAANNFEDVPPILCTMGAIYNDNLKMPDEALKCYDKAIDIEHTLDKEGLVLGDIFYNRSILLKEFEEKFKELHKAIALYQKSNRPDKMVKAYESIAIAYYNQKDYSSALHYYLISYHFSYLFLGHDNKKTVFLENEALELLTIVKTQNIELSVGIQHEFIIFSNISNLKALDSQMLEELIVYEIEDLFLSQIKTEEGDNKECLNNEAYRKFCFLLHNIVGFYGAFNRLPSLSKTTIELFLFEIINNNDFYDFILDFIDSIDINVWKEYNTNHLQKWASYCIYLFLKNQKTSLPTNKLICSIKSLKKTDIRRFVDKSEGLLPPAIIRLLNQLIYDAYIPRQDYDAAHETINFILKVDCNNLDYLDTKAEILYRMGKTVEAINVVKKIQSIDSTYYPEGNEYLYNMLNDYLNKADEN